MIKQEGLQEWFYRENMSISQMKFQYKDKEFPLNYVRQLSSDLIVS